MQRIIKASKRVFNGMLAKAIRVSLKAQEIKQQVIELSS